MTIARVWFVATLGVCIGACANSHTHDVPASDRAISHHARTHLLRLHPGEDVRGEIERYASANSIHAGAITSAVGSLKRATLRYADGREGSALAGPFEVVSLSGTVSSAGVHLHMAIADREGRTFGGHVVAGCMVYTTLELAIEQFDDVRFTREHDAATGYKELQMR